MKPIQLIILVIKHLKIGNLCSENKEVKLAELKKIEKACESTQFLNSIKDKQQHQLTNNQTFQVSPSAWIGRAVRKYRKQFCMVVMFHIISMLILLAQPFINNQLKQLIARKFDQSSQDSIQFVQIVGIFFIYKVVGSFTYLASDFWGICYGVTIQSFMTANLIKANNNSKLGSQFVACLQDDSERLQFLPSSSINSIIKIVEFIIFSSILISKLHTFSATIAISYWLFLLVVICLALYSSKLNLKIMSLKQKRIQLHEQSQKLLEERRKQIKSIKNLMIVDGIGLILPWVLNVFLMVFVYGIIKIPKEQKYFVILIFGLIRSSIAGLGSNLNLFAQGLSSLSRISSHINASTPNRQDLVQILDPFLVNSKVANKTAKQDKNFRLELIFKICNQMVSYFYPILVFLIILSFASNIMYGYCAKSILVGQSIFQSFNLISLTIQLLAPILLFSFMCRCNLRISWTLFERVINLKQEGKLQVNSEVVNRMSGDFRLLDRQLYFSLYGSISHINNIAASFIYTSIIVADLFSIVIIFMMIMGTIIMIIMCNKFMQMRKQCYRKQAVNKGKLLQTINNGQYFWGKWMKIYGYKIFGYSIQVAFLCLIFALMIVISTVAISVVILSSISAENSSVLVMMFSQLDSQFFFLFIQIMMLQVSVAATARCYAIS